jgi:hypothetical protein
VPCFGVVKILQKKVNLESQKREVAHLNSTFEGPPDAGKPLQGPEDVPLDSSPGSPQFFVFKLELFACPKTGQWAETSFRGANSTK